MLTTSQLIFDLLHQSKTLLLAINGATEDDLIQDIEGFIKKQEQFEQKFEEAQAVFLANETTFTSEELTEIIGKIKEINSLLYDNDQKVKQTTKKVTIKNLEKQINTL
jgi:hypothetical protein